MTIFPKLLANLPNGMIALYQQTVAALQPEQCCNLIVALRSLMCSASRVTISLIADELEGLYEKEEVPDYTGESGDID